MVGSLEAGPGPAEGVQAGSQADCSRRWLAGRQEVESEGERGRWGCYIRAQFLQTQTRALRETNSEPFSFSTRTRERDEDRERDRESNNDILFPFVFWMLENIDLHANKAFELNCERERETDKDKLREKERWRNYERKRDRVTMSERGRERPQHY